MRRAAACVAVSLALLALVGCMRQEASVPELLVIRLTSTTYEFRVVGATASRYVWSYGDGVVEETTVPNVVHTYAGAGVYVVQVEGYGRGNGGGGDGSPGAPNVPSERLIFRLSAVVDTRPALVVTGVDITPVDPPRWYAPGTPAWPAWHYPATVPLRFRLLVQENRPGEIGIVDVNWKIFNAYGQLLEDRNGHEWIWYEAMTEFVVYGCPGGKTEYRVYVAVRLTDGSVVQLVQPIYACPPSGCG